MYYIHGGGNLTLSTGLKLKQDGDMNLIQGLYALCPYIAGERPQEHLPSSIENNGLLPTVISVNECDPLRDEGIEF